MSQAVLIAVGIDWDGLVPDPGCGDGQSREPFGLGKTFLSR